MSAITNNYNSRTLTQIKLFLAGALAALLFVSQVQARGITGKQGMLQVTTMSGKRIDLKQYRGKPVLVVFWATWCKTCEVEMPALEKFYAAHKSSLEIIAVSVDRVKKPVKKYLKQHKLSYPVAWLEAEDTKSNFDNIQVTPTAFLVDPQGKVARKLFGRLSEKQLLQLIKPYVSQI